MVYGVFWGSLLTSIDSLLGSILAFSISRHLGKDFIKKIIKKDLLFLDNYKERGLLLILILRLIPLFPFKLVSYSAGFSEISLGDFSLATLIGSLPGIIVYSNLGDKTNEIETKGFFLAVLFLIILVLLSLLL